MENVTESWYLEAKYLKIIELYEKKDTKITLRRINTTFDIKNTYTIGIICASVQNQIVVGALPLWEPTTFMLLVWIIGHH